VTIRAQIFFAPGCKNPAGSLMSIKLHDITSSDDIGDIFYFPPYHPGCRCVAVAATEDEIPESESHTVPNDDFDI
jgi:hypothetical protein